MYRHHDPCILYLDDCFGYKELAPELEKIGYQLICHGEYHNKRQGVKDEEIIPLCARSNWLLTTTDKNMVLRHRELLKRHRQSLVFTSNNRDTYDIWLAALKKAKVKIERAWKKRQPPWVGRLHPTGFLEVFDLTSYAEYQAESVRRRRK